MLTSGSLAEEASHGPCTLKGQGSERDSCAPATVQRLSEVGRTQLSSFASKRVGNTIVATVAVLNPMFTGCYFMPELVSLHTLAPSNSTTGILELQDHKDL